MRTLPLQRAEMAKTSRNYIVVYGSVKKILVATPSLGLPVSVNPSDVPTCVSFRKSKSYVLNIRIHKPLDLMCVKILFF